MKILLVHSDFIEYEAKEKAVKIADALETDRRREASSVGFALGSQRVDDCLVVFCSAEEGDASDTAAAAADEIRNVAKQVGAEKIVIYPFVHLTQKPAKPDHARKLLAGIAEALEGLEVHKAPFGWYKSFTLKCKGHPLAELSREITGKAQQEAIEQERKVKSSWFILSPDGRLDALGAKGFDFSGHKNLEKFAKYETAKSRAVQQEPPHAKLMRKLEIADYEPGSDPGNIRYYPKGRLIKSLLEQWVTEKVIKYGAMEIESPIMYDYEHPSLSDYLKRFPARQYVLESAKKKFFLRFSACFGQFLMNADMTISYRNLPMKMYELTRYSFRLEKAGELAGLRRLRSFTMPDMHTLCRDEEQAKDEFKAQFLFCMGFMKELGLGFETAIRFTEGFWKENKDFVVSLAKTVKKPVLIEMWDFRYAYFDPKFEFNFVDAMDKAAALSTVQIDHENAERYGIEFTDSDNKRKKPLILHCSPSGAIERVIYALLEKASTEKNPALPLWLSPTQVRLCPVNDSFVSYAEEIAGTLDGIRVDIDDRSEGISRKVRSAEMEWVPFIVVIGEKEKKSKELAVRFRKTDEVKNMPAGELVGLVKEQTTGFPHKPLCLDRLLTKRPVFVG